MSGTGVLVFVVTLMSIFNHSSLISIVELPSIHDKTFNEYKANVLAATNTAIGKQFTDDECQMILNGRLLTENQFNATLINYNEYKGVISGNSLYKEIHTELSNFTEEASILKRIISFQGCGDSLKNNSLDYLETTVENYIELRKKNKEDYRKEKQEADEEIEYLKTLVPMTSNSGRIKILLLNTLYGNSHNQTNATDESLRSVWLFLLKKLDPMFGESYISYVIRMIQQDKMPLPKELIPHFYGKGKLQLFDKFDIWPELHAVFVMYYLFHCDFELTKPTLSKDKPVEKIEPIIKQSDVSPPSDSNKS